MFCKSCGIKSENNQKFCTSCGAPFSGAGEEKKEKPRAETPLASSSHESPWSVGRIITVLIILAIVGFGIYGSLDKDSISKNNEGLTSFDSGDSQTAINQFQQASKDAITNDTKINTLKNLGYVYATEGQNDLALSTFNEAFALASEGTFDYYLISGEIALLEGKPNAAQLSYNKAYQISPNEFQINNALAMFYLDLEEIAPQYKDYKKALAYAQRAYDLSKLEIAKQNLAIAYYFNENYNQTISLLSSSDLNQHPYAAYWLGLAYVNKEDHATAKIYLQKAVNGGAEVPQEIYDYLNSN